MIQQFGLEQISAGFIGLVDSFIIDGPGQWIGRMNAATGAVPVPPSPSTQTFNYTF